MKHGNRLIQQADDLLSKRDLNGAKSLLKPLLAFCKRDPSLWIKTAILLMKLPDFLTAFRLLSDSELADEESRLILATAANFLGASQFALRLLEQTPESTRRKYPVETGQILSTNYFEVESLKYFANAGSGSRPKPVASPDGDKALLMRCYPLLEMGRSNEVLAIASYFINNSYSPSHAAFATVFRAWAYAKAEKLTEAERELDAFKKLPGGQSEHWPNTLFEHVAGIVCAKQGRIIQARKHLDLAWRLSYKPGWQPEATWLQILYWRGWIEIKKFGGFSEEWARLISYPLVTDAYLKRIEKQLEIPAFILSVKGLCKSGQRIHIDLENNYVQLEGRYEVGISLPMRLLAALASAGPYGIPLLRAFDLLWPEEPLSLKTHLKRLEQLVLRLKKNQVSILWKQNHIWLHPKSSVSVRYWPSGANAISEHPFFKVYPHFDRKDVERFFRISSSSAKRICSDWIERGWIRRSKDEAKGQYRSISRPEGP